MEFLKWLWRLLFRDRELDLDGRERDAKASRQLFEQQQEMLANLREDLERKQRTVMELSERLAEVPNILKEGQEQQDKHKEMIFHLRSELQLQKSEYEMRIWELEQQAARKGGRR